MIFESQKEPLQQLQLLANAKRQSVLVTGPKGSGKSYIARQYATMVGVEDYIVVAPKVNEVRETTDTCISNGTSVLLCIENLDLGVPAASYALLKFLEEPIENVYIVVTCRNIKNVPDTIVSRSTVVDMQNPRPADLELYCRNKNGVRFDSIKNRLVWKSCNSFSDCDTVLEMSPSQVDYFDSLQEVCKFKDNVSGIVWSLSHYDSSTAAPIELVIRCVMEITKNPFITRCGIDCLRDLSLGRVAQHAVLSKFAFDCKYCE